jgi:uncharacterized integral membrane protein
MVAIIITLIFAIGVAFFATQNTASVVIHISEYSRSVPLYLIVLVSVLVGFVLAWILHLLDAFASLFALRGKDSTIKKEKKTNLELTKHIHQLELENTKLAAKEENKGVLDDNSL